MKESVLSLKENNTTLVFLLSNCPQVLKFFYDWLVKYYCLTILVYDYKAIGWKCYYLFEWKSTVKLILIGRHSVICYNYIPCLMLSNIRMTSKCADFINPIYVTISNGDIQQLISVSYIQCLGLREIQCSYEWFSL